MLTNCKSSPTFPAGQLSQISSVISWEPKTITKNLVLSVIARLSLWQLDYKGTLLCSQMATSCSTRQFKGTTLLYFLCSVLITAGDTLQPAENKPAVVRWHASTQIVALRTDHPLTFLVCFLMTLFVYNYVWVLLAGFIIIVFVCVFFSSFVTQFLDPVMYSRLLVVSLFAESVTVTGCFLNSAVENVH